MTLARKPWREGAFTTFKPKPPKPTKRSADPVTPAVYAAVMRRDGDCLLRRSMIPEFDVSCDGPHQWAHRLAVEYGGASVPSNGTRLCLRHHDRAGRFRRAANTLGLHLYRHDPPASSVPVTLGNGRRVLLDESGGYVEVP